VGQGPPGELGFRTRSPGPFPLVSVESERGWRDHLFPLGRGFGELSTEEIEGLTFFGHFYGPMEVSCFFSFF